MLGGAGVEHLGVPEGQVVGQRVLSAWTSASSPPFLAQIPLETDDVEELRSWVGPALRGSLRAALRAFRDRPYTMVWIVADALAERYAQDGRHVYAHIEEGLGVSILASDRAAFRSAFRAACKEIGIALPPGGNPTEVYFPTLGVADAQLGCVADAMLDMAVRGSPPIEDDDDLRRWQERACERIPASMVRVRATLAHDTQAHYARQFCEWVREEPRAAASHGVRSEAFRRALTAAADARGVDRSALVPAPTPCWTEHGMGLVAHPGQVAQRLIIQGFPEPMTPGRVHPLGHPWPSSAEWRCGSRRADVRTSPAPGEAWVFDRTSGARIGVGRIGEVVPASATDLVVVAGRAFEVGGRLANPVEERFVAFIDLLDEASGDAGAELILEGGRIVVRREARCAVRLRGPVIGRSGGAPMLSSNAFAEVVTGAGAAEAGRLIRITFGHEACYVEFASDDEGRARVPLIGDALEAPADPAPLSVALLVKGATRSAQARAEARATAFLWPDTRDHDGAGLFAVGRVPTNFAPNTSERILLDEAGLRLDPHGGYAHAVVSLRLDGGRRDFDVPFRGTRIVRHRMAQGVDEPVAKGAVVTMGHADRQDTITVHSTEADADLLVRGRRERRPFVARTRWTVSATALREDAADDLVCLAWDDGRVERLLRLHEPAEPRDLRIEEDRDAVRLELRTSMPADAVRLVVFREGRADADEPEVGDVALGARPLSVRSPEWLTAEAVGSDRVAVVARRAAFADGPALALLWMRAASGETFVPVQDARGRACAVALAADRAPAPNRADAQRRVHNLVRMMGGMFEPICEAQIRTVLTPRMRELVPMLKAKSAALPLWRLGAFAGDGLPRVDLLHPDLWPDLFEADAAAFTHLRQADALVDVAHLRSAGSHDIRWLAEDDGGRADPLRRWLDLAAAGDPRIPRPLDAASLRAAFADHRRAARQENLAGILGQSGVGQDLRLVLDRWGGLDEALLTFDEDAGRDRVGIAVATYLSAFSRAARGRRSLSFHQRVAERTGLALDEVTAACSLATRAAPALFGYFMLFWELHDNGGRP